MKNIVCLALILAALTAATAMAQNYSIDWYKVAGGGGTSTGGTYSVSGTVGQPDAGAMGNGANYSLTGGFWAIYAVNNPGTPMLTIAYPGTNRVVVSWPAGVSGWTLQTNVNLATTNWGDYLGSLTGNTVTLTNKPPPNALFFRLKK